MKAKGYSMKEWMPAIAALIAAIVAVFGYLINARLGRLSERARVYAEALSAVERYKQLPYWFYRIHDSTQETRAQLAARLGETQEALAFHRRWLDLTSPSVGVAYNAYVDKVQALNSDHRRDALSLPPPGQDEDIELMRNQYPSLSAGEREECVMRMREDLKLRIPFRARHSL